MKVNGTGLFAERLLYVDWLEERSLSANPTVVTPSDVVGLFQTYPVSGHDGFVKGQSRF